MIADGSITGVIDGHKYNRVVRLRQSPDSLSLQKTEVSI